MAAVFVCGVLTSCGSPSSENYKTVLPYIATTKQLGGCSIEIRRHAGHYASALTAVISVDGRDIGNLRVKQRFFLYLPEGSHKFSVRWRGDGEAASSVRINLHPNETVRLGVNSIVSRTFFYRGQPTISEM